MYSVLLEKRAEKDLDALERSLRKKIVERLLLLRGNPRPAGSKKLAGLAVAWRLRIGDFRILYEINDKSREVRVYRVKHRSKVYQ